MSSGVQRLKSEKKFNRLKKKKRHQRPVNRYEEDRIRASMIIVLEFFLLSNEVDPKILAVSLMKESSTSTVPAIEYHPDNEIYSKGISYVGVSSFLRTAVEFCHDIAREGRLPIVSVGSGDGSIEEKISEAYRKRYGEHSNLDIILVDPDPKFKNKVHFEYVDELIKERPSIVGQCAVFIFWPLPQASNLDQYDIEAVRSLQPHGVLTVYESAGGSGSTEFVRFLRSGIDDFVLPLAEMGIWNHQGVVLTIEEECDSYGLDNYQVYEVAQRKIYEHSLLGTQVFRLAIARRMDFDFVNICPAINWTCKQNDLEFRKFLRNQEELSGRAIHPSHFSAKRMEFNMKSLGFT